MGWNNGAWTKNGEKITGKWYYNWHSDTYTIILDNKDHITDRNIEIIVHADEPLFNGWRLIEDEHIQS